MEAVIGKIRQRALGLLPLFLSGALAASACAAPGGSARRPAPPGATGTSRGQLAPRGTMGAVMLPASLFDPTALSRPVAWSALVRGNPKLAAYVAQPSNDPRAARVYTPKNDVAALQFLVDRAGNVVAVRARIPASAGRQPWFDGGTAGSATGTSWYTQTLYLIPPAGRAAGTAPAATPRTGTGTTGTTATTPPATTPGTSPAPATPGTGTAPAAPGTAPAPAAPGSAMPGTPPPPGAPGTAWPGTGGAAPTATTGATYGLASLSTLLRYNPRLGTLQKMGPYVPGMGQHYGHPGPGIVLMTDRAGHVVAVAGTFPADQSGNGWQGFYDQEPNMPGYDPTLGRFIWSQHVYFVNPAVIR
ncbi:MAG: hypothetical protein QJR08_08455 [Bacillota bacterium]|nr:hypothetical protein [Bacillota bacterium]